VKIGTNPSFQKKVERLIKTESNSSGSEIRKILSPPERMAVIS